MAPEVGEAVAEAGALSLVSAPSGSAFFLALAGSFIRVLISFMFSLSNSAMQDASKEKLVESFAES